MRHLNSYQVDNHYWVLSVTDGYHTQWTATLDSRTLTIRQGEKDYGMISGEATLTSSSESDRLGDAMSLMYNWAQIYPQCNEKLSPKWKVLNPNLIHHRGHQEERDRSIESKQGDDYS